MIQPTRRGRTGRGPPPQRKAGMQRVIDVTDDFARANGPPLSRPGFPWRKHDDTDPQGWGLEIVGQELIAPLGHNVNAVYLEPVLFSPVVISAKIIHGGLSGAWDVHWMVGGTNAQMDVSRTNAELEYDSAADRWRLIVRDPGDNEIASAWQAGKPASGTLLKLTTAYDSALWPGAWFRMLAQFGAVSVQHIGADHNFYPFLAMNYNEGALLEAGCGFDDFSCKAMLRGWIPP